MAPGAYGAGGLGLSGIGAGGGGVASGMGFGSGHGRLGASGSSKRAPKVRMGASAVTGGSSGRRSAALKKRPSPKSAEPGGEGYNAWGASIYLSNDDTMSLSSAQRVRFAIEKFLPLPAKHIRHHELLNYYSFQTAPVQDGHDFSVKASLTATEGQGAYALSFAVQGRQLTRETRRNAALTIVVDRSGSMSGEGRMAYLKRGLLRMTDELEKGDLLNLVLFDHEVCTPLENFVVGRDGPALLKNTILALKPRGSTDVHLGLTEGYQKATASHRAGYSNRVLLITDALANTGVTSKKMIAAVGKHYDRQRIRLSGIGVGRGFNDDLLDKLTERGRGAYVFLGSEQEVDRVLGSEFISLVETTALDVHFRLHLPPSLRLKKFHGEESSTVKSDVQAIHYFANTSQLFLSDLVAKGGVARPEDSLMLTLEYQDPESGAARFEEYAFQLGEIAGNSANNSKARLLMRWADGLTELAGRPTQVGRDPGSWSDTSGYELCRSRRAELEALAKGSQDPEVSQVLQLWKTYCSRFEQPRNPVVRP